MFRSLYSKLAAVLAVLFFLVGLSFVAVTVFSTGMYQQEVNQKLNAGLAEQIVSGKILMQNNQVNRGALDEIFNMLMVVNPSIELYLLDPEGRIMEYSAPEGKVKRDHVDLGPVKKWLAGRTKAPILGDDPRSLDGKKIFTAAPIHQKGELEGYLYVILGGEVFDTIVQKIKGSYIFRLSAWMILASIVFALIAGLVLFALLTGRLRHLANAMEEFRKEQGLDVKGAREKKIPKNADEIDHLSFTFTQMAERIRSQMEELKGSDKLRRELVANVSHDLRTPLATLRGYIETLLIKDDSFGPEERKKYLNIAIDHCKRLGKLVSELLELAKLESLEIPLRKESFNLGELVQDVIQKFRLRADEKGVSCEAKMEDRLAFVYADIGLIERVLENLIENALNNTRKGGSVLIAIKSNGHGILVQVKDTGVGIPEEELPFIFQRFYRSDKDPDSGTGHSGLGLAIAKRILDLHDQRIEVASKLNSGTTTSFTLPVLQNIRE